MSRPFARSIAMFALIPAAMRLPTGTAQRLALDGIGPYESRGKGKGLRARSRNTAAQVQRASIKARNVAKHRSHA
jgi:hypothetical protein